MREPSIYDLRPETLRTIAHQLNETGIINDETAMVSRVNLRDPAFEIAMRRFGYTGGDLCRTGWMLDGLLVVIFDTSRMSLAEAESLSRRYVAERDRRLGT